jgi:hypothetical protein
MHMHMYTCKLALWSTRQVYGYTLLVVATACACVGTHMHGGCPWCVRAGRDRGRRSRALLPASAKPHLKHCASAHVPSGAAPEHDAVQVKAPATLSSRVKVCCG